MHISISDRSLLLSLLTGAVVLAGTSACSRPDQADTDSETNQPSLAASPADTQATAVTSATDTGAAATSNDTAASPRTTAASPRTETTGTGADQDVSGYQPMAQDTIRNDAQTQTRPLDQTDTVAVGDSAHIGKPGERLEGSQASEQANQDTLEDQADTGRIRPPEDSSETTGAAVGSREMARDTSVELAQGDTMVPADTSAIQVTVDTTTTDQQTEVAVENQAASDTAVADTAVVVGDSAAVDKPGERLEPEMATAEANADTLISNANQVRPPEDSTEVLGNVTTDESKAETRDAAAVAAAGVASTGNAVTGANAVAQMSRQGQSCAVATDPADIRWDMAGSPATLNPCGTGTMTLPRIVTGEE
jgi:hypothetical protein